MRVLEYRHSDKISEDVSDHVWRLLGQSVHAILERSDTRNHLAEERLTADVLGWTVSGQADLLDAEGTLSDYKVTSTFSFSLGEKPEWEQQLNMYAWLYRKAGFDVKKLQIVAILRDWVSSRAGQDGYPECGVLTVEIPLWDNRKIEDFVFERVTLHQRAEKIEDADLPNCTDQERWLRPESWAVKKPTNVRAFRVFDNEASARAMAEEKKMLVEHRPGEAVRCERFCLASQFCSQFQATKKVKQEAI